MDSVLDFLFLRRLKFEYTSPPICPITPASASGLGITGQVISPILAMPAPVVLNNSFLTWNCQTGDLCYNVYEAFGNNFVEVAQCLPPNTITFCSAGCWTVSAVVGGIEQPGVGPFCIDGTKPFTADLPAGTMFHVYKNGVLTLIGSFCVAYETCMNACYAITRVTADGESPLSGTGCTNPLTPSIVITTPANGTTVAPGTVVPISASVTLEGNTANSVQFYDSGLPIGASIPAPGPYTINQTPTLGHHVYTAILTYNGTQQADSNTVNLLVQDSLHDVAAYWRLNDPANGNRLDAIAGNTLVDVFTNEGQGGGLVYPKAVAETDVSLNQQLLAADSAVLGAGPGVSLSFSLWVNNTFNLTVGRPIFAKSANWSTGAVGEYVAMIDSISGKIAFRGKGTTDLWVTADSGIAMGSNTWHHIACGFDHVTGQVWIQVDLNPMVTATCDDITRTALGLSLSNFSDNTFRGLGSFSGMGLWKRRLTNAEITRLYNGGVGYPLESFYP